MYFVFIDEAGTPGVKQGKIPEGYFTLAAMVVKGDNILKMERQLRSIKGEFDIHPKDELKWGGKYSEVGLTHESFMTFREYTFDLIESISETVIASVIEKKKAYEKHYINDHFDLYQQALFLVMERIYQWFDDPGVTKEPTVFVIDSRKNNKQANLDEKLAEAYKRAKSTGTYFFGAFPVFSETPYFASSDNSAGLQLVDYCAGPIQQLFSRGNDDWYRKLRGKIRKSKYDGKISGYGIKCFPFTPTIQL